MTDFERLFGRAPTVDASAAGRVNLIGEHTDYNGGFVLPTAIPQKTRVQLAPRDDRRARVHSAQIGETVEFEVGDEQPVQRWVDYVQGVTKFAAEAGHQIGGFDALVTSTVPIGSGLSSSAAIEVSTLRALAEAYGLSLDAVQMARIGQRAENEFVGAKTGIMDQMASSLADLGTALFVDTRSLEYEQVALPPGAELIVINSGVRHDHSTGDYNTRRSECERACELLGVRELRDVGLGDLSRVDDLPEPFARRARHVVTENDRVLKAVDAMRAGDLARLGALFYESHSSMRYDYVVSVPAVDMLVDLARSESDVYGARLTGGGFGGSVVMLVRAGRAADVASRIADTYRMASHNSPTVLVPGG